MLSTSEFQRRVLDWFDQSGRKDLPWQSAIDPYRVWVSEIMLQQTQVQTVIPYFQHFVMVLPTVADLAAAPEDQVLHLWTGLGYYARARNLHRTARLVMADFDGEFPAELEQLIDLPGIGRSTAGAIRSIAFGQPAAILDGNVKRVLARYAAIDGWPGKSAVLKQLWELAEAMTPQQRVADYNQAMMDLGATLCTRSAPNCEPCPLAATCKAQAENRQAVYPGRKPRKVLPVKTTVMLMVINGEGDIYLTKRPAQGIWGSLWSFPEVQEKKQIRQFCEDTFATPITEINLWDSHRHTFSHYHLDIQPVLVRLTSTPHGIMEGGQQLWYNSAQPESVGFPAPISRLLEKLKQLR
ncbi:MAG: A/G-specific adenine glycosylase [Gammaproteobacteria bacterium]|nr:A/G-specific adenine glycosylase [Gammaproteobacteria bacterium]